VPEKRQVQFWMGVFGLVLHTQHMRPTEDGFRGGWATWELPTEVYTSCLFSTNIDSNTERSLTLRPFFGTTLTGGLALRSDTGDNDNGTLFRAIIYSRQFVLGNFLHDAEVKDAVIYGVVSDGAHLHVQLSGDKPDDGGLSDSVLVDFSTTEGTAGSGGFYTNGYGLRHLDGLGLSEVKTLTVAFQDLPDSDTTQWFIEALALSVVSGNKAGGKI
jgi:hypothetical protein